MSSRAGRRGKVPRLAQRIDSPVTIERIVPGGFGLARVLDRIVLVSGAAPGDVARLEIERTQGKTAFARISELIQPSPDRVAPLHPRLTQCGGADFQHLSYDAQLRAKREIVRDALRRIGGIETDEEDVPIVPSPAEWGYRSRAEWRAAPERWALGYVARGTHDVCDLPDDPFVTPDLAAAFAALRDRLRDRALPEGATEIRAAAAGGEVSFSPSLDGGPVREIVATVAGERLRYDAGAFFQANPGVLEPLVAEALRHAPAPEALAEQPPEQLRDTVAIDLYCGVGLFTLPLARRYRRVVGIEVDERTAAFAERNAAEAGLRNVRVAVGAVERWLPNAFRTYGRPAFLLLDPPRTGLPAPAVPMLLRMRPARIAYVSCDPATLARDLKGLLAGGYRLEGIAAVDMYPQTHHVEVVAHVVRQERDDAEADLPLEPRSSAATAE